MVRIRAAEVPALVGGAGMTFRAFCVVIRGRRTAVIIGDPPIALAIG